MSLVQFCRPCMLHLALVIPITFAVDEVAGQSREQQLVNVAWLKAHHNDPDLVLLHMGEKSEYDAAHIPGAVIISAAQAPDLDLARPEAARVAFESLGISDRSRIVVYWGKNWVSPATRVIFTLDWLGLGERVSLLDGGMPAWQQEGGSVTTEVPVLKPGKLSARPVRELVVSRDWVNENRTRAGIALIDARAASFYDGVQGRIKKGHIPGAKSVPYTMPFESGVYTLKSQEQLRQIFANAGVKPGHTIVAYCHVGQQATAVLFAAQTLGYKTLLYGGSFTDWETTDLPVEVPPAKASGK